MTLSSFEGFVVDEILNIDARAKMAAVLGRSQPLPTAALVLFICRRARPYIAAGSKGKKGERSSC